MRQFVVLLIRARSRIGWTFVAPTASDMFNVCLNVFMLQVVLELFIQFLDISWLWGLSSFFALKYRKMDYGLWTVLNI